MTRTRLFPQLALTVVTLLGLTVTLPPRINLLAVSPLSAQTQDNISKAEADRLFQQGIQQFQRSQVREAIESFQKSLSIYQEIGDRRGSANSLNNLGSIYAFSSQYEKAIELYQQALQIYQEIGDRRSEAITLSKLRLAYRDWVHREALREFLDRP